jgi:metal-sulfur cluster biosynthetic enzyme
MSESPIDPAAPVATGEDALTSEAVYDALKNVYDPEIPCNIVDLGLIYGVDVAGRDVKVQMTLTSPGCGLGPWILNAAHNAVIELAGASTADIELVFEPPWEPSRISEDGKLQLGIMD